MNKTIAPYIESLLSHSIPASRLTLLDGIIRRLSSLEVNSTRTTLLYVCTHNSRRSQFSQVWAEYFARHFNHTNLDIQSCGTEVTACNFRVIYTLRNLGFKINNPGGTNPILEVTYGSELKPITLYSKKIDTCISENTNDLIIAMMTCDHADQNCPVIPEVKERIQLLYEDPKIKDDTAEEIQRYAERCRQIGEEMCYLFSKI